MSHVELSTVYSPCYNWDDRRYFDNQEEENKGVVIELSSGAVYGHANHSDTDEILRKKFGLLTLQILWVIPVRTIYRLGCLCIGTWAKEAYRDAKFEWDVQRLNSLKEQKIEEAPGTTRLVASIFVLSIVYLGRDLLKTATLPIAGLILQAILIYGLFMPLDGRALFASIEHAWSIDQSDFTNLHLLWIANYMAPCMQPKEVGTLRNFHALYPDYNPHTLRGLLLSIEKKWERFKPYLADIELKEISEIKNRIKEISLRDADETDMVGGLKKDAIHLEAPREILIDILNGIDDFVSSQNRFVDNCIETNNPNGEFDLLEEKQALIELLNELKDYLSRLPKKPQSEETI